MKGVKYNLEMKLPNNELLIKPNQTMKELIFICNEAFKTKYCLDGIKLTNQTIYNIIKRPENCSKIYRGLIKIVRLRTTL